MSKTFTVENFKGVRQITLQPEGALVVIAGANGAGKSSFIDAFVELFDPKGTRLTPKPIRDGEDEARAEYVDTDLGLRIVRTWKKDDAGTLAVYALDGAKYSKPSDVVAELTGGLIFDPVAFLNLDEKRQRDTLLAKVVLPFDLSALEREKAGAEARRLEAGREVKRLQGALASMLNPLDAPDEELSAADLLESFATAKRAHEEYASVLAAHDSRARQIEDLEQRLLELRVEQESSAKRLQMIDVASLPDLEKISERIASVDAINSKVRAARDYRRVADEYAAAETDRARAQRELDEIEERKRAGLTAAVFPVLGLSVDDDGITYEGIPFSQVNTAARRKAALAIATAGNPKLRLVIVKDGDLLDADSLAAIRELAEERGYTVLVERDRDESRQIGFTIVDGELAEAVAA